MARKPKNAAKGSDTTDNGAKTESADPILAAAREAEAAMRRAEQGMAEAQGPYPDVS